MVLTVLSSTTVNCQVFPREYAYGVYNFESKSGCAIGLHAPLKDCTVKASAGRSNEIQAYLFNADFDRRNINGYATTPWSNRKLITGITRFITLTAFLLVKISKLFCNLFILS